MKQLVSCYLKNTTTFTISLFILLLASAKTNAQWIELGGANGNPFPTDYTGGNYIRTIATDTAGNVYANSVIKQNPFSYYFVAKWNDTAWSALGGVTFGFINSIVTDKGGNVYVGGNFSASNDSGFIAKWNGTVWSTLGGTPFNGFVRNIATDAGGNIYATGLFADANGKGYVAKWDGTTWSELGGANGSPFSRGGIDCIAIDTSGNVYAGAASGGVHYYVAKWDGTSWSELDNANGSPFNGPINSIATDANGNVYAGGYFADYNADGYYVAKWNGMAWSELGGAPFSYYITSVATDAKGNVYAGGNFGDNTGNHFVNKWNGTTWSELGGAPFNFAINTIAVAASGNVYAGGNFTDSNHNYYVAEYSQNILPLTLVSFTAQKQNNTAQLTWQTANEINTSYFNIQRSTDGRSFANIGKVAAIGSNKVNNSYTYTDNISQLNAGKVYYRLQEADNDGKLNYTGIKIIDINLNSVLFIISPNPAKDFINISSSGNVANAQVSVTDINGRTLYIAKQNFAANQQIKIPASQFAKQVLIVTINTGNGKQAFKVVKE